MATAGVAAWGGGVKRGEVVAHQRPGESSSTVPSRAGLPDDLSHARIPLHTCIARRRPADRLVPEGKAGPSASRLMGKGAP